MADAEASVEGGSEGEGEERYEATGRNQRHGIYSITLNTFEVHSLVFYGICYRIGTPSLNYEHAVGKQRLVQNKEKINIRGFVYNS